MNDGIYFNGVQPQNGDAPEFDTDAFKKRFNEIMNGESDAARAPAAGQAQKAAAPEKKKTAQPTDGGNKKGGKGKKKKHGFRRFLAVLLVLILLVTGTAAGAVIYVTSGYKAKTLEKNAYVSESSLMSSPGVTNILLMGIDTKDVNASTRSDSMILLSIDTVHACLKLTSALMLAAFNGRTKCV